MDHVPLSSSADSPLTHVRVDGLSVSFGTRRVLTDVSLIAPARQRIGLIGENGSGKSTLLAVIAGMISPDSGTVVVSGPDGWAPRVGLLSQEIDLPAKLSVARILDEAEAPARIAREAVTATADAVAVDPDDPRAASAYDQALENAERLSAWDGDTRRERLMGGLGLAGLPRDRPCGQLSGGQRSRLALACLLLTAPDVLLLDEPTNHLDDRATAYLRSLLGRWPGPVLFASHDRAFLDEVATSLIDLDPSPLPQSVAGPLTGEGPGSGIGVTKFSGAYTDYLADHLDAQERWEHRYHDEQQELKRLRASVRDSHTVGHVDRGPRTESRASIKFYADRNARVVSRRVDDARTRLQNLQGAQIRKPPADLWFRGLDAATEDHHDRAGSNPGSAATTLIQATEVALTGRLAPTSLTICSGERWLITGPNGSGKSTLLAVLDEILSPTDGTIERAPRTRIGLLAQETTIPDPADRGPSRSAEQVWDDVLGAERGHAVPLASFGLLHPRDLNRPLEVLSVGQQRRFSLALVLADPPDVLMLDEPTNHFSLLLVTQIEASIPDYPGAVIVASHDRWLRRTWSGDRLELSERP